MKYIAVSVLLKHSYFYSPSVILVHSQYPAASFRTSLGLMEYWRHNEQFHSCLTCCFISPFALVFSSRPLLVTTVINVSDAAHITISNNNNTVHCRFMKGDKASLAKTSHRFSSLDAHTEQSVASGEPKKTRIDSHTNTSAPGLFPACLQLQPTATQLLLPDRLSKKPEHLYQEKLFLSAEICCLYIAFQIYWLIIWKYKILVDDPHRIGTKANNDAALMWSLANMRQHP